MRILKIGGKSYDITLTVWGYYSICDLCGSVEKIEEWIKEGDSHNKLKKIVSIMIESAERIKKYNHETGVSAEVYKPSDTALPKFFKAAEIIAVYSTVFPEINASMAHEIPKNVEINKGEEDYAYELVMERKAQAKGIKRPNKALPIIAKGLACGIDYKTLMNAMTPGEVLQIWLYQIEARGGTGNGKKK